MAPNQRRIKKAALAPKPAAKPTSVGGGIRRVTAKPKPRAKVAPARAAAPAAAAAPPSAPAAPAASAPAVAGSVDLARQTYPQFEWALNDPELGPLLTKAAAEGWDENRLRGGLWKTNWFRTHGTAKVVAELGEKASDYLVPLSEDTRREWALKILRNEVQPTQFNAFVKETAKSIFPTLAGAIDAGFTVRQYANPYVETAAKTLEIPPASIDLMDPKWRRFLEGGRDDKGQPVAMNISEAERLMKTDSTYQWDRTKQARQQAAEFSSQLLERFGRTG